MNASLTRGWVLDQRRRGLIDRSIDKRVSQVRTFATWLGPKGLNEATEDDVQRFLDGRRISARTRYCYLSNLGCFYRWAVKAGEVDHDPTDDIIRPKLRKTLPRPIGDDDLDVALSLSFGYMRVWLVLASFAGLRCAEIAALQRDDVLWDLGLLRVAGKGDKERMVPIHPKVEDALRTWPTPRKNGYLFTRPQGGKWPPELVSARSSEFLHDIGVDCTIHQLRHWFGTRTYAVSKDIRVVQTLLGHSSPTTTAIYADFSREDARDAVLGLGGAKARQPALW